MEWTAPHKLHRSERWASPRDSPVFKITISDLKRVTSIDNIPINDICYIYGMDGYI